MKNLFFSAVIAVMATMGISSCGNCCKAPVANLNTSADSISYYLGIFNGVQTQGIDKADAVFKNTTIDLDNFIAGYLVGARLDSAEVDSTFKEIRAKLEAYDRTTREAALKAEVTKNKAEGQEYMAKNAQNDSVQTLESGLQIKHIVVGTGKTPTMDNTVMVDYKGSFVNGEVFDQGEDVEFPLKGVVKGFSEALTNMKEGGKAVIVFPSELGYGDTSSGRMPAGSTLIFELTLKSISK